MPVDIFHLEYDALNQLMAYAIIVVQIKYVQYGEIEHSTNQIERLSSGSPKTLEDMRRRAHSEKTFSEKSFRTVNSKFLVELEHNTGLT